VSILFDCFTLDLETRQLTAGAREIHLAPKGLELLATLLAERPNVVSKEVLQRRLWPETYVVDANLSNLVGEVRAALSDSSRAPRFVRTVHGIGYAFCGHAVETPRLRRTAAPAACWLEVEGRRVPLPVGNHVVGREHDAAVRLDAATASRRHAVINVSSGGAVLEDCGSKNGTFCGHDRVVAPIRLVDGAIIRIGSQRIIFHAAGGVHSTETQADTAR
jgi:DNA-binding winged helix-turn-helix (wHTH) protein